MVKKNEARNRQNKSETVGKRTGSHKINVSKVEAKKSTRKINLVGIQKESTLSFSRTRKSIDSTQVAFVLFASYQEKVGLSSKQIFSQIPLLSLIINSQLTLNSCRISYSSGSSKSMGPNGMHSRVLKELPDVLSRPLNYFFNDLGIWRGLSQLEACKHWLHFQEGQERRVQYNHRPVCLTLVPSKFVENITLGVTEEHLKDN